MLAGDLNGFHAKMQRTFPLYLGTHDPAHRVNLCCHVLDNVGSFKKLEDMLRAISNWFSNSPQRRDAYASVQSALALPEHSFVSICQTRWLTQASALKIVMEQLPGLLLYLQKLFQYELPPELVFVQRLLTDVRFQLSMSLFAVLLEQLQVLVKVLQYDNVLHSTVGQALDSTIRSMRKNFVTPATQLQDKRLFAVWYRLTEAPEIESPLKWDPHTDELIYQVVDKNGDATNVSMFMESPSARGRAVMVPVQTMADFRDVVKLAKQDVKDAAQALINDLTVRFPPTPLLNAMSIINPHYWRLPSIPLTMSKFETDVDVLIAKFGAALDVPQIKSELEFFFQWAGVAAFDFESPQEWWLHVDTNPAINLRIPGLQKLAHLLLSLPCSSCSNERRFSAMSYLANDRRNRLAADHLAACVRAYCSQFNYKDLDSSTVLQHWSSSLRYGV